VRENGISLCKWSGGTAQFPTSKAVVGPASNVRVSGNSKEGLGGPCPPRFLLSPPDFFLISRSSSFG